MNDISWTGARSPARSMAGDRQPTGQPANLADLLERILDKGIVIVGDIRVNLLDIELLTIKLRLLVASVDRAKEMGIDWWEHDPSLSSRARADHAEDGDRELAEENRRLRERLTALEQALETGGPPQEQATEHKETAQQKKPAQRRRAAPQNKTKESGP